MENDYVVWSSRLEQGQNFCILDQLVNVKRSFELRKGISRAEGFPENAALSMDAEYPKAIALADNVYNICRFVVVSRRLKEFIESRGPKSVEYLQVGILNHKKRLAAEDYFIIHPVDPQDCLDAKESGAVWSEVITDQIDDIKRLVIEPNKLDHEVSIFRLKHYYRPVLVRRELADAISAGQFSGVRWIELDKYPEQ